MNVFYRSKKTVASVLSGFNKVLDDLDAVAAQNVAIVETNRAIVREIQAQSEFAEGEIAEARAIRAKIAALIAA